MQQWVQYDSPRTAKKYSQRCVDCGGVWTADMYHDERQRPESEFLFNIRIPMIRSGSLSQTMHFFRVRVCCEECGWMILGIYFISFSLHHLFSHFFLIYFSDMSLLSACSLLSNLSTDGFKRLITIYNYEWQAILQKTSCIKLLHRDPWRCERCDCRMCCVTSCQWCAVLMCLNRWLSERKNAIRKQITILRTLRTYKPIRLSRGHFIKHILFATYVKGRQSSLFVRQSWANGVHVHHL